MVSALEDETLKVWESESGRALATLEGHSAVVTACGDARRPVHGLGVVGPDAEDLGR